MASLARYAHWCDSDKEVMEATKHFLIGFPLGKIYLLKKSLYYPFFGLML